MARIAEEEIERLKREVDLAGLVEASGVTLKKAGADLVGRCPFHEDSTPSLVVTQKKGLWHCMGACQMGGTVIDWVMQREKVSFRHATELLRTGARLSEKEGRATTRSTLRRMPAPVSADAADDEVLSEVVDYYHATLAQSPEALSYLAKRKIADTEAIARFRIGFSNRTLGLRLPTKDGHQGRELRGRLERIGIYRRSGHEHLVGSITIPVVSPAGRVTELYGRKIGAHLSAGTPLHLYLPGPHRGVWNEEALMGSSEVILAESLIDALSLYCAGFANVTASYGTSGFTDDHKEAFARHGVSRVLIAYDHDAAGDAAAETLATELATAGIECFRVTCPYGADLNDVCSEADDPREAVRQLIRGARFMRAGSPGDARPPSSAAAAAGTIRSEPAVSPVPAVSPPPARAERHDELMLEAGDRLWRVRHIPSGANPGSLKVNLMVRSGDRFHVDVVDLYAAKARQGFIAAAAPELHTDEEVLRDELGRVLLATEEAQAAAESVVPETPPMSTPEREAALQLLSDPELTTRVGDAFSSLGLVGESDAALCSWLVLVSRLAERPLGAVIQSSSAAGKSTLAEAALSLVAPEQTVAFSAMTGQALYYLGDTDLSHKVLSIAETEGAERASYALKLLVSEGRLSIAAAGKDPQSGRLVTSTYEVNGPVALLMTTTAAELEPELANRLVVLAIDESRAQTRAVQAAQRRGETLDGLVARAARDELVRLHQNAQRLLSPVAVVNPHATSLSFSDTATRHRRDNAKYLGLIRAVAIAHQHQRPRRLVEVGSATVSYIEASGDDVALARRLGESVLETTTDEMAPSTRRLLHAIASHVGEHGERRFTRRELRDSSGLSDSQLKVHLARLVDLEHVACNRAGTRTTYELVDAPTQHYDSHRPVSQAERPVDSPDRPVLSPLRPVQESYEKAPPARTDADYDPVSAGIGRFSSSAGEAALTREDDERSGYRPVSGRTRMNGTLAAVVDEGGR